MSTLREQVASAIAKSDDEHGLDADAYSILERGIYLDAADAAIGVVLTAVAEQIKALPWEHCSQADYDRLLTAVVRFGEDAP